MALNGDDAEGLPTYNASINCETQSQNILGVPAEANKNEMHPKVDFQKEKNTTPPPNII